MDHKLICTWLKLAADSWPPDHYTLLGLRPGEADRKRIEQHAAKRMEYLRRYQLSHPELANEAMNRVAQALTCLTDKKAKATYDLEMVATQGDWRDQETVAEGTESLGYADLTDVPDWQFEGTRHRHRAFWLAFICVACLCLAAIGMALFLWAHRP